MLINLEVLTNVHKSYFHRYKRKLYVSVNFDILSNTDWSYPNFDIYDILEDLTSNMTSVTRPTFIYWVKSVPSIRCS